MKKIILVSLAVFLSLLFGISLSPWGQSQIQHWQYNRRRPAPVYIFSPERRSIIDAYKNEVKADQISEISYCIQDDGSPFFVFKSGDNPVDENFDFKRFTEAEGFNYTNRENGYKLTIDSNRPMMEQYLKHQTAGLTINNILFHRTSVNSNDGYFSSGFKVTLLFEEKNSVPLTFEIGQGCLILASSR